MSGKRRFNKKYILCMLCIFLIVLSAGCSGIAADSILGNAPEKLGEFEWQESEELIYATGFTIDKYEGGYRLITTSDSRYLIVPDKGEIPKELANDIKIINQPVTDIYMVATAVMDMFRSLDALDAIRLTGMDADGWYIEEAKEAIEAGRMMYAGKYSTPDYELILSQGCRLAIENIMITHTPEVKEQLEKMGITVLVDAASYEEHPLGRVEWIKLYGAVLGKEDEARNIFEEQVRAFEEVQSMISSDTGNDEQKTVAFFYITSNGAVSVRRPTDYIPKIIELAGGAYPFDALKADWKKNSSVTMQLEEFYAQACKADYLIYNSSTTGGYTALDELVSRYEILRDFDAVKNNRVWCTTQNFYQESLSAGGFIKDIYSILNDEIPQTKYLYRLE